jgi:hypothetical protein
MAEQGSVGDQTQKPSEEPFPRQTGSDLSSFSEATNRVREPSFAIGGSDFPLSDPGRKTVAFLDKAGVDKISDTRGAFNSWRAKAAEGTVPFQREKDLDLPSFTEANSKLRTEIGKVSEAIGLQAGAVKIVEGFANWAAATGDQKTTSLLSGNVEKIMHGLSTDPDKVSETVAALTEGEAQAMTKKLEDEGIIGKKSTSSTVEPPTTTAK